jgi:hypothetical protein
VQLAQGELPAWRPIIEGGVMGWARLDDGFHDHPKVDGISLAAVGLYTLCLTWAHRHRRRAALPGHVPASRVVRVAGRQADRLAAELVQATLWEREEGLGGYLIHDFGDYLPKERDPDELKEAGRKGAANRWQRDGNLPSDSMASDSSRASASASPTRPVPKEQELAAPAAQRERDELFEAVAEVCGITVAELTKTSRGPMNNAVGQLRSVSATPGQVKVRANRYRQRYPDTSLTPSALVKHWPALAEQNPTGQGVSGGW